MVIKAEPKQLVWALYRYGVNRLEQLAAYEIAIKILRRC